MSMFSRLFRSRGGKIYLLFLALATLAAFFLGYFYAKNETVPIIIEKSGN